MNKQIKLILLFFVWTFNCLGQNPNHTSKFDIDRDGKVETILFFDDYDSEFEKTEFTQVRIITDKKTLYLTDIEVCVAKNSLYKQADTNIDQRIGVIYDNGKIFLWLTGYEYGCCLNKTVIFQYFGDSLKTILNEDFEFYNFQTTNSKRYFVGASSFSECTDRKRDYEICSYYPTEYLLVSNEFKFDKVISSKMAIENNLTIETNVDPYNANSIFLRSFGNKTLIVSKEKTFELENRDFGIISLIKLNKDYFLNYSNQDLKIARNELFAFKGYKFASQDLNDFFSKKSWYIPSNNNADSIYNTFTEIEKYNIDLIKNMKK